MRAIPSLNVIQGSTIQDPISDSSGGVITVVGEEPLIDLSDDMVPEEDKENNSDHQCNYNHFQSLNSINNTDLPRYIMVCNGKKRIEYII